MKIRHLCCGLTLGMLAWSGVTFAQTSGHYPAGVEGIKGGSLPPPGLYLRDYNLFYWADRLPVGGPPASFDAFVYAQAPRLVWITDTKILGGYYGMDVLVPFYYGKVKVGESAADTTFALGDIMVEPITLSWHWKQFDLGVGYGFWAPTGDTGTPGRLLSRGFWSQMLTLGGTWFPDAQKTWALSLLNRYEIHSESWENNPNPNTSGTYTPGNTLTMELGISKSITKTIDVGLVGYYVQQTTADSGAGTSSAASRVFALGPEISTFCPQWKLFTSLRYEREFGARYRPEGNTVTLTLTKIF